MTARSGHASALRELDVADPTIERDAEVVVDPLRGDPGQAAGEVHPYARGDSGRRRSRSRDWLRDVVEAGLEIDTVTGFQDRETEAVIIDRARSAKDGELGLRGALRRMNVAITRARSFLLVLGIASTLQNYGYYRNLRDAVQRCGAQVSAGADDADAL